MNFPKQAKQIKLKIIYSVPHIFKVPIWYYLNEIFLFNCFGCVHRTLLWRCYKCGQYNNGIYSLNGDGRRHPLVGRKYTFDNYLILIEVSKLISQSVWWCVCSEIRTSEKKKYEHACCKRQMQLHRFAFVGSKALD